MKQRLYKTIFLCAALLAGGCAYALFVQFTDWGIPCLFHTLTGLQCPGCGVSRMLLSLLQLDFAAAWHYHPLLLCLLPAGLFLGAQAAVSYVRLGCVPQRRWRTVCIWSMIVLLLIFGIIRNL